MTKLPAFQFYPADWRKDPAVQSLSYFDRGVWLEILCLMHESDQRGKLLLNGKKMPDEALARLLGLDKQILTKTLSTLIEYGVASIDEATGALISRRMVRDEEIRHIKKEAGLSGGNPKLTFAYNKEGFVYLIRRPSDNAVKIGIAADPKNRLYKLRYVHKDKSLFLENSWLVEDMGKIEEDLHSRFAKWKNQGEWFNLPADEIKKLIFLMEDSKEENKSSRSSVNHIPTPSSSFSSSVSSSSKEKEDKDGGGGVVQPAAAVNSFPNGKESLTDYLLRKQLEFPHHDVQKVYAEFKSKCGSVQYPNLKNTSGHFDKWLADQYVELPDDPSGGDERASAIAACSLCDSAGFIEHGDGVRKCRHEKNAAGGKS